MKKLLIGMFVSTLYFTAWADGMKTNARHKEFKEVKHVTVGRNESVPSDWNNPGYTGVPKPNAPRKQANSPKRMKNIEPVGTIPNLQPK